ncbi:hypothetical protein F2Q70_00039952 [Brassica cretica]|uniref:Uncharacterized protein n=1 Tax=Brassica cretica TaxID=69181 RepID=A0A8S9KBC9_BRACR|nr:hypothetical protein F2Q70_00039952 [Brassica cretica]
MTYRRNKSSEITPRKFIFPRKSLRIFRRNSEETNFRGNSEDHLFVGNLLGIYRGRASSGYFDGFSDGPILGSSDEMFLGIRVSAFSLMSLLVSRSEALIRTLGRVGWSEILPLPFSPDVKRLILRRLQSLKRGYERRLSRREKCSASGFLQWWGKLDGGRGSSAGRRNLAGEGAGHGGRKLLPFEVNDQRIFAQRGNNSNKAPCQSSEG